MTATSIERGRITPCPYSGSRDSGDGCSMVGATVNQFIVQTALREAERIIEQEELFA